MKVLVIGSGGREHALALALSRDPEVSEVHAAPGNPGIAAVAELHDVKADDGTAVADLAEGLGIDLVVIGPEAPLVAGVADVVRDRGIDCFGPSAEAARLEGSKAFAKEVMAAAEVPTAMAHVCTKPEEVEAALDAFGPPDVVKADGLAAGKGVVVTESRDEALDHAAAGRVDAQQVAVGVGAQVGMLKFSRQHESEADRIGLIFMAMAGYDPHEAPRFWERMSSQGGGAEPPEWLSTHPSHGSRIKDLNEAIPEAMKYYKK